MIRRVIAAAAATATLSACAAITYTAPPPVALATAYDPDAHMVRPGDNTIQGNALLRTVGGEVRTCAGFPVKLTPVTPYSTERTQAAYGNTIEGYRNVYQGGVTFEPKSIHFESEAGRTTTCDAQGDFEFAGIADGSYYVITSVTWGVPGQYGTSTQGGALMQRVEVRGGEVKRIVMTQN